MGEKSTKKGQRSKKKKKEKKKRANYSKREQPERGADHSKKASLRGVEGIVCGGGIRHLWGEKV